MKRESKPKMPRLGPEVIELFKRKAGAHPHRNTKRLKTRGEQKRRALSDQ